MSGTIRVEHVLSEKLRREMGYRSGVRVLPDVFILWQSAMQPLEFQARIGCVAGFYDDRYIRFDPDAPEVVQQYQRGRAACDCYLKRWDISDCMTAHDFAMEFLAIESPLSEANPHRVLKQLRRVVASSPLSLASATSSPLRVFPSRSQRGVRG